MKDVFTAAQRAELMKWVNQPKGETKTFIEWLNNFKNN